MSGGIIGKKNIPTIDTASGIWGLNSVFNARYTNTWPTEWASSANRFNLVGNPVDIFAWSELATNFNCNSSRENLVSTPYGGIPLRMVATGTDPHVGTYNNTSGGGPWNIDIAANGETWEVRVIARSNTTSSIQLFIFGTSAAGAWNAQSGTIGNITHTITAEWAEYSFRYTFANPTVERIQIRLDGDQAGNTAPIWFDGLQVYKIS